MLKKTVFFGLSIVTSAALISPRAMATIYSCPNPATPALTSTTSSIVSAGAMAAHCFGNGYTAPSSADWNSSVRAAYLSQCVARSSGSGVAWPEGCNPIGTIGMLNTWARPQSWAQLIRPNVETNMGRILLDTMKKYTTPIMLPLHGSWRHWAAVTRVETRTVSGSENFWTVQLSDGLASGVDDGTGHAGYSTPYVIQNAVAFISSYYSIIGFPGAPCNDDGSFTCADPPHNDPWFFRWVFLYEPPTGATLLGERSDRALPQAMRAPGIVTPGQPMTATVAVSGAREALRSAGVADNPLVRTLLEHATIDQAQLVRGHLASGQPWDYYLLPISNDSGKVTAFLQLSAEDGSFDTISILDRPIQHRVVDEDAARTAARRRLEPGEQLGAGVLTWQPESRGGFSDFAYLPAYEFEVRGPTGRSHGLVQVPRHDASLVRREKSAN